MYEKSRPKAAEKKKAGIVPQKASDTCLFSIGKHLVHGGGIRLFGAVHDRDNAHTQKP